MRTYAPLAADHPLVTDSARCPLCRISFVAGDVTTLINGVPADEGERDKRDRGQAYIASCTPAHAKCVVGAFT